MDVDGLATRHAVVQHLGRLADQNRVVLDQLDLRIEQIKRALAAKTAHNAG